MGEIPHFLKMRNFRFVQKFHKDFRVGAGLCLVFILTLFIKDGFNISPSKEQGPPPPFLLISLAIHHT